MLLRLLTCMLLITGFTQELLSQSVGIGTNTPSNSAALDIKSTEKGVLFPRLTSAQRNAIVNPANGLHIFNLDEKCLNFYDSLYKTWNCYCETDTCKVVTITIGSGAGVNFYSAYASNYPVVKKYVVLIPADVVISGGISFASLPNDAAIRVFNYGSIAGAGGNGGIGASGQVGAPCFANASVGAPGGNAITTRAGVTITIENHGLIAAGGGGGGGGGRSAAGQYGGGGGGGAGTAGGPAGTGGGTTSVFITSCLINPVASNGMPGQSLTPGSGGAGASGGSAGGAGGLRGQNGQTGLGSGGASGGAPGKAIGGGVSNAIINVGAGVVIGAVD